ncbi:MAG: hypothetical protein ACK444_08580 [Flavobacteriales bacterium]|jgi:hypothetical protein
MKNWILHLSAALILSATFSWLSGCKKYPEGPSLSLRSRVERLENTWKISSVTMNGQDVTNLFSSINYTETYDKEGNYSFASAVDNGSGKWEFQNNDLEIRRSGVSGQSSMDLTILKLKSNEFWYRVIDGSDEYEFHFVSQ